jgi:tetratricopeptide (TPR) repeat protein
MLAAEVQPGTYPPWRAAIGEAGGNEALSRARASFERAVALAESNTTARWELGKVALIQGDAPAAAEALAPLEAKAYRNPLLFLDILTAYSRAGRYEEVIAFYEGGRCPVQATQFLSDTVALAYLEQARTALRKGDEGLALQALDKTYALRPGDLYATYFFWREALAMNDLQAAVGYRDMLTYFSLEAVHPGDERLLDYAGEVIPDLLADGLWDHDATLNVVAFLVWQCNRAMGVEHLLERLIARYPTEPVWPFYLAELYHRRGDLSQAESVYRRVLEVAPAYTQVFLRLGMLAEASCGREGEAVEWYERYHEMAPDDLLGLRKLIEVYDRLDSPAARPLREELEAIADDRHVVAELLEVPVESVALGPNLVENGGFEVWEEGKPEGWGISNMARGNPRNRGRFVCGVDTINGWDGMAARVNGLWLQQQSEKEPGRFGLRVWDEKQRALRFINLKPHRPYLIAVMYRTEGSPVGGATMWLTGEVTPEYFPREPGLPSTVGQWRRFVVLRCNPLDEPFSLNPLLRIWAPERAWFDDMTIREVLSPTNSCSDSPEGG